MKDIHGQSVRSYAFMWIDGGCLLHQWASGGRGCDREVVTHVKKMLSNIANNRGHWFDKGMKSSPYCNHHPNNIPTDIAGLTQLLEYLIKHEGEPATPWNASKEWHHNTVVAKFERQALAEHDMLDKGIPLPGIKYGLG
jgi:hypothetical protein